jgi:L-ascorbate metabolism protein UlaG (beta-lactamase superfamily)
MKRANSDNFNGKRFFNKEGKSHHGIKDVLAWKLKTKPKAWPSALYDKPVSAPTYLGKSIQVSFIGHSSFLIQTPFGNFLTDPVYSNRVGPFSWAGPKRFIKPGITWESLPHITAVMLSHDHYDHCDKPTLDRISKRWGASVIAPLGMKGLLTHVSAVHELDWWQTHPLNNDVSITLVPAKHWGRRFPWDTNKRLWGGFYLNLGLQKIYFAGDSGYDSLLFKTIQARLGSPDLAFLPIGAYEPRWFMQEAHMNPNEALQVHIELGSKKSIAMHWGTFQLTDEGRDEPRHTLIQAMTQGGIPSEAFLTLEAGQSITL